MRRLKVVAEYLSPVFLLLLCTVGSAVAAAPQLLLERMQVAIEQTNYEGTLLHMTPGQMEQFRVYHRVAAEGTTERMVLVDGAGAEIIRTPTEVICIFPEQSSVVIEGRANAHVAEGPLRSGIPSIADISPEHYKLKSRQAGKVAERETVVVAIKPQDEFRYGYRLWLDRETYMPLKSQLIGADASMPLEEIRFVSIALPEEVSAEAVLPGIDTSSFSVTRHSKAPRREEGGKGSIDWIAEMLPPGFMLSVSRYEFMEGVESPRIHLVYTDGLASVSVFMDVADEQDQTEGHSSMGAANAFSVRNGGFYITAMGEVPSITVQQIAQSMRQSDLTH